LHKAIAVNAKELVGMDLSKEGVDYLKDKGIDVVFGDAQCFDLKKQFDVIVAGDIIEHLDNIGGFLESCKRHLKNNGKLIVTTPNPWHWKFIIKSAFLGGEVPINPEHTCWLCPRSLRQIVSRYGFRVNRIEFGSRYPRDLFMPLPSGWKHTGFYSEIVLLD
jgi:2-polyprenyl-3-methyl-5-hydroxy-6-metoxy-1,4-benzoquinol methylase